MERAHLPAGTSGATDFARGAPTHTSPLVQSDQHLRVEEQNPNLHRSDSTMSRSNTLTPSRGGTLKKKQSLKKSGSLKRSLSKTGSRPGSVRSLVLDRHGAGESDEMNSAFFIPVPTSGNPTEILANRFQAWRKVLKDLITYFRDIQKSYEARSKSSLGVSNVINNTSAPPMLLTEGGLSDAMQILRDHHKQALAESNKARMIEEDVIVQLTGLRSDLQQKVKEIKNLAGDFKNNVDKETEGTRRAVRDLQEALGLVDLEPSATSGKGDPFIVRLGVERQIERQIDEENYLHRAFLNLENSGRELESIVVGEIQKAYNAYAGILKREADEAYDTVNRLRSGPIALPKDHEWNSFVNGNEHFVDPRLPVRSAEHIHYPGKNHPSASEVRAGMLERKSKYLKSYTPGWYILSPTHLHEFKSADRINSQVPIMSLYLPEQKLGSRSSTDSSSHKFMLKGRQTGGMHRGHAWVFRAESHDTMLAWYEDIKSLTEKTGEERKAFVRQHARSVSGGSNKPGSISSDGVMEEDEADKVPYSAASSTVDHEAPQESKLQERPQPGGRFPSEMNVNRDLQAPLSPSSGTSFDDRDVIAAAGALPGSGVPFGQSGRPVESGDDETNSRGELGGQSRPISNVDRAGQNGENEVYAASSVSDADRKTYHDKYTEHNDGHGAQERSDVTASGEDSYKEAYIAGAQQQVYNNVPVNNGPNPNTSAAINENVDEGHGSALTHSEDKTSTTQGTEYNTQPVQYQGISSEGSGAVSYGAPSGQLQQHPYEHATRSVPPTFNRHDSNYSSWIGPTAAGAGGATVAVAGAEAYHSQQQQQQQQQQKDINPQNQGISTQMQQAPQAKALQASTDAINPQNALTNPNQLGITGFAAVSNINTDSSKDSMEHPASAVSASTGMSIPSTINSVAGEAAPTRPPISSNMSTQTVSHLHIPGEYPPTPAAV